MTNPLQLHVLKVTMPWAGTNNILFGSVASEVWAVYSAIHKIIVFGGVFYEESEAKLYIDQLNNPDAYPGMFTPESHD